MKKTRDLLGLTCLCSSLFSEPAVTRLLLSTRIMRCPADGQRRQYMCVSLQLVCVGEDGSFKCLMSVCCQATWEQTDHMHGNVGRQAVLMAGKKASQLCSLCLAQLLWSDSTWKTVGILQPLNMYCTLMRIHAVIRTHFLY